MDRNTASKEIAIFFAITLGASFFVFWGPLALFKIPTISFVSQVRGPWWAISLFLIGGFVPSITSLFLTWKWEGVKGLHRLGRRVFQIKIGWLWYLVAVVIVLFGSTGEIIISRLVNRNPFDLTLFVQQLGSFLPLLIIGPLSEEIGWRGYAQDRLQKIFDPILASVILGVFWALWHLPLFFIVGAAQHELGLPFLPFLFTLAALSVCYGWLHNNTDRSIWTAIFFHWVYTYFSQVVSTGTGQTILFSWLKCIPYVIAAALVIAAWKTSSQPEMKEARAL